MSEKINTILYIMSETSVNDNESKLKYLTKHIFRLVIAQSLQKRGTNLSSFLQELDKENTIQYLREEHVISDEDIELLHQDPSGIVSLEHVGFTLLYTLMRTFFCKLSDDDQLIYKGIKPDQNDLTMAADLTRLQNHILELDETELTEEVFVEKCRDLEQICKRLGIQDAYNETSDSLTFDDEMKNTILEEFNKWKETHQRFETGLDRDIIQAKCRRLRLYILLVDGGTKVFRKLFDEQISPRDLQTTLSMGHIKIKIESLGKIIGEAQKNLLYPTSGSPNSTTFDITLLSCLLRNICNFNPNDRLWMDKKPKGTTMIEDIVRNREARNEVISHVPRTGNLAKTDFERHWCEISMALLRLNNMCNDPLPNLKLYIDDLKVKRLDPECEHDYQSIIESWKRIDERRDEIMQFLRKSTLESAYVQSEDTVKDVLDDKYFVETEQFTAAYNKLKEKKIIVLNGAPGEGKTTVAKKLLLKVSNNHRYIQLHSYKEWRSVNTDSVDAILIDDIFGAGSFSKEEYRKWQKYFRGIASAAKKKDLYVIITSRKYILSEALDRMFVRSIFSEENIFTLSSEKLKESEKQDILEKHFCKASEENQYIREACLKEEHSETIYHIVQLKLGGPELGGLTIGFPECTRLFSSSVSLYEKGIKFYKDPMTCVKSYMSELLADDDTLIAFFVLWAQESKILTSLELECPIDETAGNIIAPIRKLQFQPEKHIRKIRHILRQHRGGFINLDGKNESFTFSHRVVQDAVGLVAYEINPTAVIEQSDSSFIENFIRVGEDHSDSVHSCNMAQLKLNVSPARYLQISCRLGSFIIPPDSETLKDPSLFRLGVFEDKEFCLKFLDALERQGCLKTFLNAKTRSFRSEFAEFKFLNNVSTDMGVLAYLVWMKEDTCPLIEVCIKTMLSLDLTAEGELSTSLLIAVKLGSCKLVNLLIEQGAKVHLNHLSLAIVTSNKVVLEQLFKVSDISSKNDILHRVCQAGYVEVVSKIFDDENDMIQLDDVENKRIIENAIKGGHADVLKVLLQKLTLETNLTFDVRGNELPFYHFVVSKQKNDLLDVLTDAGFQPTSVDIHGRTPFLYAIYTGKSQIMLKLCELSVNANVHCLPDNKQNTALYMAIKKVTTNSGPERDIFRDIALKLCRFRENIHLINNNGKETALELACKKQLVEIANAILQHGDPFHEKGTTLFHHFVTKGCSSMLSTLLKCDLNPNEHDIDHKTPFMLANTLGKRSIIEMLQEDLRIESYNKKLGLVLNTFPVPF